MTAVAAPPTGLSQPGQAAPTRSNGLLEERPGKKKTKLKPRSRSSAANLLGEDGLPIPPAPGLVPPLNTDSSNGPPAAATLPAAPLAAYLGAPVIAPLTDPSTTRGGQPINAVGLSSPSVGRKKEDGRKAEQQRIVYDSATEKRMTELLALWTSFQANTRQHSAIVQSMDSRLLAVEKAVDRFGTFCGEYQLIWKVRNFAAAYEDAVTGRRIAVLSPVFDTHRNGYKLQLSLCPNGDGKGKGQAMSLFFAILKGPYDSLLQWPYTCRVMMTLLDQVADPSTNPPHDIVMTFTPNPRPDNEPFLGMPTTERNLSLGFPKFIGLKELFEGEYIKDDTMYIKVQVDLTDVVAL